MNCNLIFLVLWIKILLMNHHLWMNYIVPFLYLLCFGFFFDVLQEMRITLTNKFLSFLRCKLSYCNAIIKHAKRPFYSFSTLWFFPHSSASTLDSLKRISMFHQKKKKIEKSINDLFDFFPFRTKSLGLGPGCNIYVIIDYHEKKRKKYIHVFYSSKNIYTCILHKVILVKKKC